MSLLIYSFKESPRLGYILKLIFTELSGLSFNITHDKVQFSKFRGPKINYSDGRLTDSSIWIIPHSILFEDNIIKQEINIYMLDNIKTFFMTSGGCDLPFDIFAASFYLVSRYEEYLPFNADKYGRFDVSGSIAHVHGFLDEPVVNQWVMKLKGILQKKFPELSFPGRQFKYISTIDIDNAWAYLHKGFIRTTGAFIKSLIRGDFNDFVKRIHALTGTCKDPYYNFDFIHDQEVKYGFRSVYFFLAGKYGKYDKNIPIKNRAFKNLILDNHEKGEIGIHPSYNSNADFRTLKKEVYRLARLINRGIEKSRQHYLVLTFPDTYQRLIELGIKQDYSLGYSSAAGFRAGICDPFRFYDLSKEQETNLILTPFHIMDVTLREHMKLKPDEAIATIKKIITGIKDVNGTFVSLWHNESLSETGEWKGWRRVYEEMLKIVNSKS